MRKAIYLNTRKSAEILAGFVVAIFLASLVVINVGATTNVLFFDDFNREENSETVDNDWEEALGEIHGGKEEIKGDSENRFARLHGEDLENEGHNGHAYAAITHGIASGEGEDPLLTFKWQSSGTFEGPEQLQVLINGDDEEPFWQRDLDEAAGEDWNDAEINLPSEFCEEGGNITFRSTAEANAELVDIDDVSVTCESEEEANGSISGQKWYDVDGDGVKDDGEPALRNWPIRLSNGDNTETDGEGYYEFSELSGGDYTVCEYLPENWFQTYPNDDIDNATACEDEEGFGPWGYDVTLEGGDDSVLDLDFGNSFRLSTITAFKFNDLNGNGEWEQGDEPSIEGWQICLSPDGFSEDISNFFEPWEFFFNNGFEQCKYTNASGQVEWLGLYPGEYDLWENSVWGWEVTTDDEYEPELDFNEDQTFYFGNQLEDPSTVRAFKFKDVDKNGGWDEEIDEPVEEWEICLYMWPWFGEAEDYELLSCKFTDEFGWTEWQDLSPGEYYIEEVMQPGWEPTTDVAENGEEFELDTDSEEEFWFGNWSFGEPASLRVFKFYDLNQNGEWDWEDLNNNENWNFGEGEMPISGWQICTTNNFEESEGQFFYDGSDCQQTDESGWVEWNNLQSDEYLVFEPGVGEEWVNTTNNNYSVVFLDEGDEAEFWFGNFSEPGSIHASKRFIFSQDVSFLGEFNLGDIFEGGGSFFDIFAPVSDWEICLSKNINESDWDTLDCKRTDDSGWVWWDNLPSGYYKVEEEQRPSWWQSVFDTVWYGWLSPGNFINDILFLNSSDDGQSPHSEFDDSHDHEIIDTEIVSLSLTGQTTDDVSGAKEVTLKVYNVERGLENSYPVGSFFDIFTEISCDPRHLSESGTIPIEIVALELTSVEPLTMGWSHNWTPPKSGIYCFEVSATDNAGRVERTDYAGPVAYVPVPEISEETSSNTTNTSVTIEWSTSHPATSRVIYDTVSHEELGDSECPNPNEELNCYGYAFSTDEDSTLVAEHSVTITDLALATTYYYRSVSHGSPEAVGGEGTFTTEEENSSSGGSGGSGGSGSSGGGGGYLPVSQPQQQPQPELDTGTVGGDDAEGEGEGQGLAIGDEGAEEGIVLGEFDIFNEAREDQFSNLIDSVIGNDPPEVGDVEKHEESSTLPLEASASGMSVWTWVILALVFLGGSSVYFVFRKYTHK